PAGGTGSTWPGPPQRYAASPAPRPSTCAPAGRTPAGRVRALAAARTGTHHAGARADRRRDGAVVAGAEPLAARGTGRTDSPVIARVPPGFSRMTVPGSGTSRHRPAMAATATAISASAKLSPMHLRAPLPNGM